MIARALPFFVLFILLETGLSRLQAQAYYYGDASNFSTSIESPESYLGYPVGAYHTRHDLIVGYGRVLAEQSDRVRFSVYGKSHENRTLYTLLVSSPENLKNIDAIKEAHRSYIFGGAAYSGPVIVYLGYNIHGNEPSSSEAAMLTAYTLAASKSPKIEKLLSDAVIIIDPTINPDGRDRHTQWVNSRRSKNLVADPLDAEHNETWPKGRTNHYWFDLNRDLLLAVHPESRGRLRLLHDWYPNVMTDFHEMGTSSTYFFEPKRPTALRNPITPTENPDKLNTLFKKRFAEQMDAIKSLYFTHEAFDATYPGYGSTYGDLQGGLALLFEQASSRGHVQKTPSGKLSFKKTILHQYLMSMTTVYTAVENRDYLLDYQRRFFNDAVALGGKSSIKAYAFGSMEDMGRTKAFLELLDYHAIRYGKASDGMYYVPTKQSQYRLIRHLFEPQLNFRDSVYYDASAWSLAHAYNMRPKPVRKMPSGYRELSGGGDFGVSSAHKVVLEKDTYGWLLRWDEYKAPAALYALLKKSYRARLTAKKFEMAHAVYDRGTVFVALGDQIKGVDFETMRQDLQEIADKYQVRFEAIKTGLSIRGIDLGSRNVRVLKKPKIALITGEGINAYEAGEIWYLLDYKMDISVSKIPTRLIDRVNWDKYNTLILVSGSYEGLGKAFVKKLKAWVRKGNTLIATNLAAQWVAEKGIVDVELYKSKKDSTKTERRPYDAGYGDRGSSQVSGVILNTNLDLSHPVAYGYRQANIPVYKKSNFWLKPSKNPYATVGQYQKPVLISGYVSEKNKKEFLAKEPASIIAQPAAKGRAILFSDNPVFRGTWLGTEKLLLNAILFGHQIRSQGGGLREMH